MRTHHRLQRNRWLPTMAAAAALAGATAAPARADFTLADDGYFGATTPTGASDKLGHAWAGATMTRALSGVLHWHGVRRGSASLIGGGLAWAALAAVELGDGFRAGFSPGDVVASTAGTLLGIVLERAPHVDRALDFRVQYWPSASRPMTGPRRFDPTTDHDGQTFVLALHLPAMPALDSPRARWARYIDVVLGFQARGYASATDAEPAHQRMFVGVSLNAQGIIDDLLPRVRAPYAAHVALHALTEVVNVPSTTLPLATTTSVAEVRE